MQHKTINKMKKILKEVVGYWPVALFVAIYIATRINSMEVAEFLLTPRF